jgi:competence protein ComFA
MKEKKEKQAKKETKQAKESTDYQLEVLGSWSSLHTAFQAMAKAQLNKKDLNEVFNNEAFNKEVFNRESLNRESLNRGFFNTARSPWGSLIPYDVYRRKRGELEKKDLVIAKGFPGQQLLLQEVLSTTAHTEQTALEILQLSYLLGDFMWKPGVYSEVFKGMGLHSSYAACGRCGYGRLHTAKRWRQWLQLMWPNEQLIPVNCARCGEEVCYYCPRCIQLGLVKSCQPFLLWRTPVAKKQHTTYQWKGALSPLQEEASQQLVQFILDEGSGPYVTKQEEVTARSISDPSLQPSVAKEFLLWAVTGAGKTEMLFKAIYMSLQKGEHILLTSPRRDVITELAPRLKSAFPATAIAVLHADSEEKLTYAQLTLATTHQVLRFYQHFDWAVIDEEDAFPYHHDEMLPHAVKRALKPDGKLIYLTATPGKSLLKRVQQGMPHFRLFRRFHGFPLSVPKVRYVGAWRYYVEKGVVITPLVHFVTHLMESNRYGYLFVPRREDTDKLASYMEQVLLPYIQANQKSQRLSFSVAFVHAQIGNRAELVQQFREHKIRLLITTTILERGVTIPYCDVAILGSDDPIFDAAALVQMAGRAGRKVDDPKGEVWLLPQVWTLQQAEAIKQIQQANQEGRVIS